MRVVDLSPESAFQLDSGVVAEGKSSKGPGTALVLLFHQTQNMVQEQLERRKEESALLAETVKARLEEAEGETQEVLQELERRFARRAHLVAEAWKVKDMAKVMDIVEEFERKLLIVAKERMAEHGGQLQNGQDEKLRHNLLPGLFEQVEASTQTETESLGATLEADTPILALQTSTLDLDDPILGIETPLLERESESDDNASLKTVFITAEYEIVHSEDLPSLDSPEIAMIEEHFAKRLAGGRGTWSL